MERFGRCIAMPNTSPPKTTTDAALAYYDEIMGCLPAGSYPPTFKPLMTLYLTDNTTAEEIKKAKESGKIFACKYYPAGATTNSEFGVSDVKKAYPAIKAMAEHGLLLLIHSEVSRPEIDIFDREKIFIDEVIKPLVADFPNLQIVMEHISTSNGVEYVKSAPDNVAASITCHHLLYNRNKILVGGIKPHYYCLPVLKREEHRAALLKAATSGNKKFIMGTDSAPHETGRKESACGCAGLFTGHAAVELYAEAFDSVGKIDMLAQFITNGGDHYGLPRVEQTLTLEKTPWVVPETYEFGGGTVTPLRAGEHVLWKIVKE